MFQIGQIVQIRSNRGGVSTPAVVAEVGKTSVKLDNGERYRLRDGHQVGTGACDFYYRYIISAGRAALP